MLADAKPLPIGTRVLLSREQAWDSQMAEVDEKGAFTVEGLPPERYSLSVNVRGYHVSRTNGSYDLLNGFGLKGTVRSDIEGLRLLLEPGASPERPRTFDRKFYEEYQRRLDAPLRGAPAEDERK